MPIETGRRRAALALGSLAALAIGIAWPARAADIKAEVAAGAPGIMYRSGVDGCRPIDTPDIDPRAFRDDTGGVAMFTLHYVNRALRGPDLSHLKIDCAVALDSKRDADPAQYNDRRYMTATWTDDGRHVAGIVHHEYHAESHQRCAVPETLGCWFNSVLSFSSGDGGRTFSMDKPAVVASAPFAQDVEQGRHRGFFNPSNIFSDGRYKYFMASTTGWSGQRDGACLFRTANPFDSSSWRAYDGAAFTIRYSDPYVFKTQTPKPCAVIAPFGLPVGSVTRHAPSGVWMAAWMAIANKREIPVPGIYYAVSADLLHWSAPRVLLAGKTIHESGCGGSLVSYPSIIDENAKGRNFDDMGDAPWLYYVQIKMNGCDTGERTLVRARLNISSEGAETRK